MNNEFERMQKEVVVAYFEVLYSNLGGGTEESTACLSQERLSPPRDLKPVTVEYETGVTNTVPLHSV